MAKVDIPESGATTEEKEEKKPVAVMRKPTKGSVNIKKKGLGKKFSETFFAEDAETVGKHLFKEVLAPAGKDTFREMVTRGLDMFLYRDDDYDNYRPSGSRHSSNRYKSGRDREYYSYDEPRSRRDERHSRARMSDRGRSTLKFDMEFDDRDDALDAYHYLKAKMKYEEYDFIRVTDLFEYLNVEYDWSYEKYGWYDLENMTVRMIDRKWVLKLPRAELID